MLIIGVDYHPSFQQISFLDQETGECGDRQLVVLDVAEPSENSLSVIQFVISHVECCPAMRGFHPLG